MGRNTFPGLNIQSKTIIITRVDERRALPAKLSDSGPDPLIKTLI